MHKVISVEGERFARNPGEGIGEAVGKVQLGRMPSPLAEVSVGAEADPRPAPARRLDGDVRGLDKAVESAAGDRVAL